MFAIKKRTIVISFVAMLAFILLSLAGCGSAEKPPEQSAVKNEPASAENLIAMGKMIEGYSYDYVLTTPAGEKITHKLWVEPGKMRSEMTTPENGQKMISIINLKDSTVYVYQPALKQATKMKLDQPGEETTSPGDYLGEVDPAGMIFTKRETFDGKECLVYETNIDGAKGKMWIWEEKGMPLRVETQSGQDKVVVEFLNFVTGDIDDSLFELPKGVTVIDMSSFGK